MSGVRFARKGDWVQIKRILIEPGERAPQVPDDTAAVPLEMRVKGFLQDDKAQMGDEVTIKTVTGRLHTGTLVAIVPSYTHDFGRPVPELLDAGEELLASLKEQKE